MKILESIKRQPHPWGTIVAALCAAGITTVAGLSLPGKDPAARRDALTTGLAEPAIPDPRDEIAFPETVRGHARRGANCPHCGVIEAVRTILHPEAVAGKCVAANAQAMRIPGGLSDAEETGPPRLTEIIALATLGEQGARNVRIVARYQMVVRLRDGSKRIFDEETPRTLRVGDRVRIIDGAADMNG